MLLGKTGIHWTKVRGILANKKLVRGALNEE